MSQLNVNAVIGKTGAIDRPLFKVNLCHVYGALPWQAGAILEDGEAREVTSAEQLDGLLRAALPESIVIAKKSGLSEEALHPLLKQCPHRKLIFLEIAE